MAHLLGSFLKQPNVCFTFSFKCLSLYSCGAIVHNALATNCGASHIPLGVATPLLFCFVQHPNVGCKQALFYSQLWSSLALGLHLRSVHLAGLAFARKAKKVVHGEHVGDCVSYDSHETLK